jgi:hypothetical protein
LPIAVVAQAQPQARDHAQQFGARQRLPGKFAFAAALAGVQQLAQRRRFALLDEAPALSNRPITKSCIACARAASRIAWRRLPG